MSAAKDPPEDPQTVETATAVHLLFCVAHDWESDRDAAVAELERKLAYLEQYAGSPGFRQRHGQRIGVVRMQAPRPLPSVVTQLMNERGIEVEVENAEHPEPGLRCAACGRRRLREDQVSMTENGWACPSCFRAWNLLQGVGRPPRRRLLSRFSPWMRLALLAGLAILCLLALCHEVPRFLQMNDAIRTLTQPGSSP